MTSGETREFAATDQQSLRLLPVQSEFAVTVLFAPETAFEKILITLDQPGRQKTTVRIVYRIRQLGHVKTPFLPKAAMRSMLCSIKERLIDFSASITKRFERPQTTQ